MPQSTPHDTDFLNAALIGYTKQRDTLDKQIRDVRARLGQSAQPGPQPGKHRISAEGRARIAAAQRKRWKAQKRVAAANA